MEYNVKINLKIDIIFDTRHVSSPDMHPRQNGERHSPEPRQGDDNSRLLAVQPSIDWTGNCSERFLLTIINLNLKDYHRRLALSLSLSPKI